MTLLQGDAGALEPAASAALLNAIPFRLMRFNER
jgi:hypothetical protein